MSTDAGPISDGLSVLCALLAVIAAGAVARSIDRAIGDRLPGWAYGVIVALAGLGGFLLGGHL